MNERQLSSFIIAADEKSFSKAAIKSYISTPALVQQINLLEDNIGFQLFNRNNRGIELTPAGEVFYKAAKEILEIYNQACKEGKDIEKEHISIKIAYPFEKFPLFLLKAYQQFHQDYPYVNIEFIPLSFNNHIKAIKQKIVDISIIGEPKRELIEDLSFDILYKDTYSFCMSHIHPLHNNKIITKENLKKYPIIIGQYNYLKDPFIKQLPNQLNTIELNHEYDLTTCTELLISEELMVIHSSWKENYQNILTVKPSNIDAGNVGVLYHKKHSSIIKSFIPYLKRNA